MRLPSLAASLAAAALLAPALLPVSEAARAQTAHHPSPDAGPGKTANPNPVVASVNGDAIHLDDVRAAAQTLPDEMRQMPPNVLFPMIVNQVIDQKALLIAARRDGTQKDPQVQKAMQAAADTALQNIYLTRQVSPMVTDQAVRDVYDKTMAGKSGEKEVHARHILLATKAQAEDVIKQLKGGADFSKLASTLSTDKASAAQNGGDLGWFKQGDMLPEFSAAAFSMNKGQISDQPVQTRYGWHVIQVLDTRTAAPPSFDSVKDQIRQKLIQQDVRKVVDQALTGVKVVRFKPDGSRDNSPPMGPQGAGAQGGGVPGQAPQPAPGTPSAD
ncbi:peptidylprolyl isomerase [Lichenicoccus roseus]|uniref:Parvulin-like PPIase n=1 Tax=Lichenicoccus roseus TaxID=2683649 RepID=A0A5R9J1A4_9PROT|nr:peptidylprolyl isomerase [Lichenicoccus roseus]TLU71322.1 peptidylprolyl isomerase [Lichenicoccus roseus]